MKSPEKVKFIKDWLSFARENLLFAKAGMKEAFSPYHTICFMCHGSAEKYLKAFLLWKGWELKRTHDLSELLDFCCEYDASFEHLFPECELLNEYITEGRYPGDLPFESIGEYNAKEAIEAAEKIEEHVLKNIHIPSYKEMKK
ncbi:HEPN domain-containing protein [bacterium]|nr:HEPN domain-containing protein [bacterium]